MKSKNIVIILMVIIGLLILGLSYNEMNKQKDAENIDIEEEVVVTQTREEKVNNFLQALKNSDYEKLSKDFVPQLAEELTYDEMIKLKALLDENWGDLINLNEPEYPDFGIYGEKLLFITSQYEPVTMGVFLKDEKQIDKYIRLFDTIWYSQSITKKNPSQNKKGITLQELFEFDDRQDSKEMGAL